MHPTSASMPIAPTQPLNGHESGISTHRNHMAPVGEDAELDSIMQDVGQEMKKADSKPQTRRLLNFKHKPKTDVPFHAQPITHQPPKPTPMSPPPAQINPHPKSTPDKFVPARPQKQSSAPIFVVFVTILVTGVLVAAAIAAYRQA